MQLNNSIVFPKPTKEAVDDAKEAAHGADDGGNHLVAPLDVFTVIQSPRAQLLVGLDQQCLQGGRHGEQQAVVGRTEEAEMRRHKQEGGERRGRLEGAAQPHGFTCRGEEKKENKELDTGKRKKEKELKIWSNYTTRRHKVVPPQKKKRNMVKKEGSNSIKQDDAQHLMVKTAEILL